MRGNHAKAVEAAVRELTPLLWSAQQRPHRAWLKKIFKELTAPIKTILEARVVFDPGQVALASLIANSNGLIGETLPIELEDFLPVITEKVFSANTHFLPNDPRVAELAQAVTETARGQTLDFWRGRVDPDILAKRIVRARESGLSYTAMIDKIGQQYNADSQIAERLIRTSYNSGANNVAYKQLLEAGYTHKQWQAARNQNTRHTHAVAHGQTVRIDAPFLVGQSYLQYPGDTSLGAARKEIINCRCVVIGVKK